MTKLGVWVVLLGTGLPVFGGVSFPNLKPANSIPEILLRDVTQFSTGLRFHDGAAVRFDNIQLESLLDGSQLITLPGAKQLYSANMPILPVVQKRFVVPAGKKAIVHLENVKMEESEVTAPLNQLSEIAIWGPQTLRLKSNAAREGVYPGRLFSAKEVSGVVIVDLFPVQVQASTGRVLLMRSADVRVAFEPANTTVRLRRNVFGLKPAVIITSEKLMDGAKALQAFHRRAMQTETDIITVEALEEAGVPVEETELPEGYKTEEGRDYAVVPYDPATKKGYHYELAKKIKRYLDERAKSGETEYVTLLGDGTLVPPSYYFALDADGYKQWGVTDICYGAKTGCSEPTMAVGRLPFASNQEVQNYITKAERWMNMAGESQSELALYGGKAFPRADVFIGELGTLKTVQADDVNWRGVKKYFRTRGNYTKENLLGLVNGKQPSSFVYSLDHGNGNQWYVESEYVTTTEVLAASSTGEQMNPLLAAIACTNAAFDESTTKETVLSGPASEGKVSVGVGLMRSAAGSVAYLGSSRPAMGLPVYKFDTYGNLNMTGSTHGLQLMDTFYDKYRVTRGGRLGDIYLKALRAFVVENGNDMTDATNLWTYYNVELLGDPVLQLPLRQRLGNANALASATTKLENAGFGFPKFKVEEGKEEFELTFDAPSAVKASLIKINSPFSSGPKEEVLQELEVSGKGSLKLPTKEEKDFGNFQLRIENTDGVPRERQVWLKVVKK